MSRVDNVVFVEGNFKKSREDIWDAFDQYDTIYLNGNDQAIQNAINLAQYFVNTQKLAIYEKFLSSLVQNQKGQTIPKCSITLKYKPKPKESNPPKKVNKDKEERRDERRDERDKMKDDRKDDRKENNKKERKGEKKPDNRQREVYRERDPYSDDSWEDEYNRRKR